MTAKVINFSEYMAREPSLQQKALWDKFVDEYMKDFNPIEAAIRVGFMLSFAQEYSRIFMNEPYVQRLIMQKKMQPIDQKGHLEKVKSLIEATLMECMQNGQPSTRVIAANTLAKINGLDASPDRTAEELEKLVDSFKKIAQNLPD